ncbi:AMP-binding protein [Micromonospora sp. NPDC047134]|uniref:AMP-binding protein n=1 Tax=Micromonospora sp. NPDC047134 TaxID=3154340 RepID=UPI0033F2657B
MTLRSTPAPAQPDSLAEGPDLSTVRPGEVVALRALNGPRWLAAYRALLDLGAVPLLLDAEVPDEEARRWLVRAGGGRLLSATGPGFELSGVESAPAGTAGTVLLCSSGTTGAPKLVRRTLASLQAEGGRHVRFADLTAQDHVVLALPMWHAYALGWVHTCLAAGCRLTSTGPTDLGRVVELLNAGATVLPLVPTTAALLAARAARTLRPGHRLRLAMVGAGAVTDELDDRFRAAFGIGLARDYGSTETGSLFSAPADLPAGCVGEPLAGVQFRVLDEQGRPVPPGTPGVLEVRLDDDTEWRNTGDRVRWQPPDGLFILGRQTRAVRRGDRWISPDEIEEVLRAHPDVLEARVAAVSRPGRPAPALHATVVNLRGVHADTRTIQRHAGAALAAHKVPDRVIPVGSLERGPSGKLRAPQRLKPADPADLMAAAQAYKRSELLFTLHRLGLLAALATEPADAPTLAARLDLDPHTCEQLLRAAQDTGLVRVATDEEAAEADLAEACAVIALEEQLSRSWVTREQLTEVGRDGLHGRAFDRKGPDEDLRRAYTAAMHSPGADRRSRLGLRLAGYQGGSLLEITCGSGRYLTAADTTEGRLVRVGALAGGDPAPTGDLPDLGQTFDLVVVCNAIHLAGPGADLPRLAGLLAPGGRLLIDDVFLDAPGGVPGDVRLDWLTHGGLSWPTEEATIAGLARAGVAVRRVVHVGKPTSTLIVADADGPEAGR